MAVSERLLTIIGFCVGIVFFGLLIRSSSGAPDFSKKVLAFSSGEEVLVITTTDASVTEETTFATGAAESWEMDNNVEFGSNSGETRKTDQVPVSRSDSTDSSKPIKPEIYSFRIQSDIKYRYSRTYITSRVANKDLTRSQEVTFRVVLPETAFISKFVMEIDGKPYEAYVKEKEEAKRVYTEAQSQGQSAGLVEVSTRNSNTFNVNVNIKAQAKVTFNLTYEELLSRKLGRYEQSINISPEQFTSVKDFQIVVNIEETQNITYLRVPNLRNDIESHDDAEGNNKDAVIVQSGNKANISWSPSVEVQESLSKQGVGGKFVVQYDINRESTSGEILVMEGYFVHFFAPENLKPLRKHVVFILDISGSMWGRKMDQLKESQKKILEDLNPDDYFNIITFSSDVFLWSPNDPISKHSDRDDWYPPSYGHAPVTWKSSSDDARQQPFPATKENIHKAKQFIDSLVANGGTNIHDSIIKAINLTSAIKYARDGITKKSVPPPIEIYEPLPDPMAMQDWSTNIPEMATEVSTTDIPVTTNPNKNILPANVESLIIFLTDGEPTVGVTDPPYIQQLIQAANKNLTLPIFSLGFGEGADFPFLRKLSLQNYGFARKIYEASDAALQLKGFYNEIASPLLSHVAFNYTSPEYNITNITVTHFPTVFGGTEIAIAGKLVSLMSDSNTEEVSEFDEEDQTTESPATTLETVSDDIIEVVEELNAPANPSGGNGLVQTEKHYLDVAITGSGRDGIIDFAAPPVFCRPIDFDFPIMRPYPPRPTPPPSPEDQFLERLWAYLTIQQLIEKDLKEGDSKSNEIPDDDQVPDPIPSTTVASLVGNSSRDGSVPSVINRNFTFVKETPKQQAMRIALRYGFVTPFTSLVVVKPNSSDVTETVPSDARPEALDSLSAPQSMNFFAFSHAPTPMLAQHKVIGVSNRIAGPQSLAQSSIPLSLKHQHHYPAGRWPSRLPGASMSASYLMGPVYTTPRPYHHTTIDASRPMQVVTATQFHGNAPESFEVGYESDNMSEERTTETTTSDSLTMEDLTWFDSNNLTLHLNGMEYKIALNQTGEDDEGSDCTIGTTSITGKCTHLRNCVQEPFVRDFGVFTASYFCSIQSKSSSSLRFVGSCCSRKQRSLDVVDP